MNKLLQNWNTARVVRLVVAVIIAIIAVLTREYWFLILSCILLFQALLNVSCCGGGCSGSGGESVKQVYKGQIKNYKP